MAETSEALPFAEPCEAPAGQESPRLGAYNTLCYFLALADPWNYYFPNLLESVKNVFNCPGLSNLQLAVALADIKQIALHQIGDQPERFNLAPGYNKIGFRRFLEQLDVWRNKFTDATPPGPRASCPHRP